MTEPDDFRNWSASGSPSMVSADDREYGFRAGYIATRHGVVGIYEQWGERPMTSLTFVMGGRWLSATWNRTFTDRYLKTLATRFAQQGADNGSV